MLRVAAHAGPTDRPGLQLDAIKYGLGLFAVAGAAAALLLGIRRQQHTEHAQAHTEHDAAERRVTDLYTKAVEQLGIGRCRRPAGRPVRPGTRRPEQP